MSTPSRILPSNLTTYPRLIDGLQGLLPSKRAASGRNWAKRDLYFLIRYVLRRADIEHPWLFQRCREVQKSPNGHLDLWAREHYKSTIITFGLTIFDILNDPDETFGIFSHTRPIAKGFLRQIKREFESNDLLKEWFPDILWNNPDKDAPKWSEDDGLIVKRSNNPKESTVEAWGIVDSQPTSKHFGVLIYDDVVTDKSVFTADMIRKTGDAWALSTNLGKDGGQSRYIGTRYHFNDTYKLIMERGAAEPRFYPATLDGEVSGNPVLLSKESLAKKRRDQGPYIFGCQMLQNPKADETQGFREEWLRFYNGTLTGAGMNTYILVDPANEKKRESDYSAFWVVGLASDRNYYALEIIRDRLNLKQRTALLFKLHRKWNPLGVGYEKYGMMADIAHIEDVMDRETYHFDITELGGPQPKTDRIRRLIPICEQNRLWLPSSHYKTDYEGTTTDMVNVFVEEEYKAFPVGVHEDMLDALSRLLDEDMSLSWPMFDEPEEDGTEDRYAKAAARQRGHKSWMTQ